MAFNVGDFLGNAGKGIAERAVSGGKNVFDSTALGGKGYTDLGVSILSSGGSVEALKSIGSLMIDGLLDKVSDDFFSRLKGDLMGQGQNRTPQSLGAPSMEAGGAGSLKFPHDLGQYAFALQFSKYKRPVPLSRSQDAITQTIYLPLPRELTGGHQNLLETPSTGLLGSIVDAAVLANETGNITGEEAGAVAAGAGVGGAAAVVAGVGSATRSRAIARAAQMAAVGMVSEGGAALIEQTLGATPNPNLSVSYKGPTLRTFTFNWEFSPNNAKESETLTKILEEIQKRSLGAYSVEGSSAILSYPETVQVKILPGGKGQIGELMKFKKAMVNAVDVNYAPNGIPSFFKGTKSPTFIAMTIVIQEIEYFVSADYGGTNAAGYSQDIDDLAAWGKEQFGALAEYENPPEENP